MEPAQPLTAPDLPGLLHPRYRGLATGVEFANPLRAAGAAPAVDLAGLARLFTGPCLLGEFLPGSPWQGVQLVWERPLSEPGRPWRSVFSDGVAHLCSEANTVGVKLSGGLDSLAVLCHAVALRPARRVIAYCVDLVDDHGVTASSVALRLAAMVAAEVEVVVVDPADCAVPPVWTPHGPRLDALPSVNATVAALAHEDGVRVLLNGDGADELLAVPQYATAQLGRRAGVWAARRYLADACRGSSGWAGEVVALVADRLPPRIRTRTYWAAAWPAWCRPSVSAVVREPWRSRALTWAQEWIGVQLDQHALRRHSWAEADAADAFWPRAYLPASGPVPEASPFLRADVVAAGLGVPIVARYDPALPTAYQRCKAAVVSLLPEQVTSALPARKQYFTSALANTVRGELDTPIASAAGLLDRAALTATTDTATRMTAAAVESWLAGALAAGHRVPGLDQ